MSHFEEENPVKNLAIRAVICYNKIVSAGLVRNTGQRLFCRCNYSENYERRLGYYGNRRTPSAVRPGLV